MAKALMEKGKALELEMNVRGALECYEVSGCCWLLPAGAFTGRCLR